MEGALTREYMVYGEKTYIKILFSSLKTLEPFPEFPPVSDISCIFRIRSCKKGVHVHSLTSRYVSKYLYWNKPRETVLYCIFHDIFVVMQKVN